MRLSRCTSTATCTAFGSLRCRRPCVSRMTRPSRFAGRAFSFALRSARVLPLRMFHVNICAEWAFRHSFGRVWRFARAARLRGVRIMRRACRPSGPSPHPSRPRAMASELPTAPRWRKSIEFGSPRRCCGFVGRPPPVSLLFAGVSSFAAARRVSSGRSISSEFDAFSPSGEPPCVCKLLGRSSDGACDPWGETFLGRSCARRAVGTSARKGRACMPPS